MTVLAGLGLVASDRSALHLGAVLARTAGQSLAAVVVVPADWPPGRARVDAEYRDDVKAWTVDAVRSGREDAQLADLHHATVEVVHARSVPAGLLEAARSRQASVLVLGSSESGALGAVVLGSVPNRLLHSAPLPIAVAPRGYRASPGMRVRRVSVAFDGSDDDAAVVLPAAADLARRWEVPLRIVSFAVERGPVVTAGVGLSAEADVVAAWVEQVEAAQNSARERLAAAGDSPARGDDTVGVGGSWGEALAAVEWTVGDLLVLGSGRGGPAARVFMGSRGTRIVRCSPVPVMVVPR